MNKNMKHGYYSINNTQKIKCKEQNCNNFITYHCYKYGLGRCGSCSKKERFNPMYKFGKKYCVICNKEIAYHATLCWDCEIEKRKNSKNHWNYKDGASLMQYPKEYYNIRKQILERDNYICQYCFKYGNEVHHIDYDKNHNGSHNLMTLCKGCNIRANRDYLSYNYFYNTILNGQSLFQFI